MSNQLRHLLQHWQSNAAATDWVLGTVYKTEGSSYRKAGAMMLINGYGQSFGLLSGGCLEADVLRHARKVMASGETLLIEYDSTDEDDWSYQLGIGCGGKVYIMLQPVTAENDLELGKVMASLSNRRGGLYHQRIGCSEAVFEESRAIAPAAGRIEVRDDGNWLVTPVIPEPHLLVFGGGVDARPVVSLASQMGWQVTLVEPRSGAARADQFPGAGAILRELDGSITELIRRQNINAAIVMSHNLGIDAEALSLCHDTGLQYLALLGPRHRFKEVLKLSALDENNINPPVSAPAGLNIGGQLPESIALSMLAECHSILYQTQSQSNAYLKVAAS